MYTHRYTKALTYHKYIHRTHIHSAWLVRHLIVVIKSLCLLLKSNTTHASDHPISLMSILFTYRLRPAQTRFKVLPSTLAMDKLHPRDLLHGKANKTLP